MLIKSICISKVITIQKNANLQDVLELMKKNHVGSVVVIDFYEGKVFPAGIITDRDIAFTIGTTPNPGEIKVAHYMQSAPITISENQGIYEGIVRMQKYGVKRLPVVSSDGSLVGIVCKDDILKYMGNEITQLSKINDQQIKNEQGVKLPTEVHV